MAFYPELKGTALAARQRALEKITINAMKELNLPKEGLVTRPLRPDDLIADNAGTWKTIEVLTTATTLINKSIADNTFISIYGIVLLPAQDLAATAPDQLLTGSVEILLNRQRFQQMKITRKGTIARYWDLTPISAFQNHAGFVDDPITVDQNTNIKIELVATTAGTLDQDKYAILGDVVEKRGILINP